MGVLHGLKPRLLQYDNSSFHLVNMYQLVYGACRGARSLGIMQRTRQCVEVYIDKYSLLTNIEMLQEEIMIKEGNVLVRMGTKLLRSERRRAFKSKF